MIYLMCAIENAVAIICFAILSVVFNHWWIVFFAIVFCNHPKIRTIEKGDNDAG